MILLISSSSLGLYGCGLMAYGSDGGSPSLVDYYHSEKGQLLTDLLPQMLRLLKRNCIKPAELTKLIVDIGPGSFTGIRFAVSYASGLCAFQEALGNTQLFGLHGFDIMAAIFAQRTCGVARDININIGVAGEGLELGTDFWRGFLVKLSKACEISDLDGSCVVPTSTSAGYLGCGHKTQVAKDVLLYRELIFNLLGLSVFLIPRSGRNVYVAMASIEEGRCKYYYSSQDLPCGRSALDGVAIMSQASEVVKHGIQGVAVYSEDKVLHIDSATSLLEDRVKVNVPVNVFTMAEAVQLLWASSEGENVLLQTGIVERGLVQRKAGGVLHPFYIGQPNGTQGK